MKICQAHWDKMRAKLDELGIGHLGAKTGEEAATAMQRQIEDSQAGGSGEPRADEWDPLMAMNFAFWSRAMEVVGLAAMSEDFGCPLCHARTDYDIHSRPEGCGDPECKRERITDPEPTDEEWIRGCAQAMCEEAQRRSLVKAS